MNDPQIYALGHCTRLSKEIEALKTGHRLTISKIRDRLSNINETNSRGEVAAYKDSDIDAPMAELKATQQKLMEKISEFNAHADVAGERKMVLVPVSFTF